MWPDQSELDRKATELLAWADSAQTVHPNTLIIVDLHGPGRFCWFRGGAPLSVWTMRMCKRHHTDTAWRPSWLGTHSLVQPFDTARRFPHLANWPTARCCAVVRGWVWLCGAAHPPGYAIAAYPGERKGSQVKYDYPGERYILTLFSRCGPPYFHSYF